MKYATLPLIVLLLALAPAGRAADVTIVGAFPADKGPGYRKPAPDAAGAVGPRHAVALDDRAFVAVDKATGRVVKDLLQRDFWLGVEPVNTLDLHANDPRILYDSLSGHWIAWVQGVDPMHGYLAVSTTSDPTGAWKGVKFPIPPHNYGAKAGLDQNGFYLTLHNGNNDTHKAHTCYAIPKADLIAPDGPDLSHLQTLPDLEIESFPAMDLDPDKSPGAPEVLLNKEFGNAAGKLYMYRITWSGGKASISHVQVIPLSTTYSTPNASVEEGRAVQPAPGGKLRADESRRTSCVFARGGSVFGSNGAKRTLQSRPGILWYEVRVSDGALLQEGLVDDPICDYLNPSLAVDRDGNVGLGCTRTSEKEFPSVYVMMHAASDPAGSMGTPTLAAAGTTYYRLGAPSRFGIGWGNYSTTCIDPSDPTLIWTCQEYANSALADQWCTAWVAFRRKVNDRITPAAIPAAAGQTTPTVTSSVVTVSNRRYTIHDYADPATKKFRVVIPEDLKTVRGLLVQCNYAGGDSRSDWTFCTYYREFMHLHDFALVASAGDIPHVRAFQAFRDCLQRVSVDSKHPELVNAPYATVGFSSGGGFASTLMTMDPDRTISAGIIEARYNFTAFLPPNPPPAKAVLDAALAIPSVLFSGGKHNSPDIQTGVFKMVDDVFVPFRPKGAEYAWMVLPHYGHEYAENRQDLLIMPLMDLAVRTRYPKDGDVTKGPIKLLSIDPATGWVADNTTWKSGLTKIVPARQFKGDLGHSSWLQDEDIAFIYRAYATHDSPLTITSPGPCGPGTQAVDPGSNVPITVDASKLPSWTKLELYDASKKLGEITRGAATQFTAKDLTPGYHVFSVLGTDAEGTVRTSDPVLVIVRAAVATDGK